MDSMAGDSPEPSSSFSGGREKKKVYMAMGAGESKAMVLWALQKFPDRDAAAFVLVHVYCHPKFIPISASPALLHMFLFFRSGLIPLPICPPLHVQFSLSRVKDVQLSLETQYFPLCKNQLKTRVFLGGY
jgi:hypothetical protein